MYNAHDLLTAFYDEHVRLGNDRRKKLADYRDSCTQRLKEGLKKLGEERRQTYSVFSRVLNQGSYAMHTLNQHPDDDYDIDVAVIFPKDALPTTALEARKRVADALLATGGNFVQEPEARTNAVTVWYAEGPHVDLAIYRETTTWFGTTELEHAGPDWNVRDPEKVTNWFTDAVENDSPSFFASVDGGQLRRITRLVKAFTRSRKSWSLPGGMITTTLVVEVYQPDDDRDDVALYKTLVRLRDRLRGTTDVRSPADPGVLLTGKPKLAAQVKRLLEKLEGTLPDLAILHSSKCTEADAKSAWNRVFNHAFWKATTDDAEAVQKAAGSAALLRIDVGIARSRGGKIQATYAGPGIAIPKGKHLKFAVIGGAPSGTLQYEWTVTNAGDEASAAGDIEHKNASQSSECWEHTAYKGLHRMRCEARRDGRVVARGERKIHVAAR